MQGRVMLRQLLPSGVGAIVLAGGFAMLLLGVTLSIGMALDGEDPLTGLSICGLPGLAIGSFAAAFLSPAKAARGALLGLSGLTLAAAAVVFGTQMAIDGEAGAGVFGSLFCAAPGAVLVIAGIVVAFGAPAQVRQQLADARRDAVLGPLARAGESVALGPVADATGLTMDEVCDTVRDAVRMGRLDGELLRAAGLFAPTAVLDEGTRLLRRRLKVRGQVSLADLGRELDAPRAVIVELVHRLAEEESFTGYVDLDHGVVMSEDAAALRDLKACPACAGPLSLVGKGLVRCEGCGAAVYL